MPSGSLNYSRLIIHLHLHMRYPALHAVQTQEPVHVQSAVQTAVVLSSVQHPSPNRREEKMSQPYNGMPAGHDGRHVAEELAEQPER